MGGLTDRTAGSLGGGLGGAVGGLLATQTSLGLLGVGVSALVGWLAGFLGYYAVLRLAR
jgi:hypothetical protein